MPIHEAQHLHPVDATSLTGPAAGVYATSGENTIFAGVTDDCDNGSLNTYATTETITVTDGTLRVGVKNNGTMTARWFGVDYITLTLAEPASATIDGVELTPADGTEMDAAEVAFTITPAVTLVAYDEAQLTVVATYTITDAEGTEIANGSVQGAANATLTPEVDYTYEAGSAYTFTCTGVQLLSGDAVIAETTDAVAAAITTSAPDAITGVEAEQGSQRIYNLSGARLQKTVRGVNIIGGKKVMVK